MPRKVSCTKENGECYHTVAIPFDDLFGRNINIHDDATHEKFRLIDCQAFCHKGVVQISEHPSVIGIQYAAISYVWKGIRSTHHQAFGVVGAEDGDPISREVLRTACIASLKSGANYIWLDRLCIIQACETDKKWQVQQMGTIFRNCHICLVLPGGLGTLVGLDQETTWINRSWTLQEAISPRTTKCVFRWSGTCGEWHGFSRGDIQCVVNGHSAMANLKDLLDANNANSLSLNCTNYTVRIFGKSPEAILALDAAMNLPTKDGKENAIWRSAMMRTSKHEADVVYSIMGLFNITLDPSKYSTRLDATIALLQSIMQKGGRGNWLAAALHSPVPRRLSTLPPMPEANTGETPYFLTPQRTRVDSRSRMKDLDWCLTHAPRGTVDDLGFFTFSGKVSDVTVLSIRSASGGRIHGFRSQAAIRNSECGCQETSAWFAGKPGRCAVVIGEVDPYPMASMPCYEDAFETVVMLLEPCKNGRAWYKTGIALVTNKFTHQWETMTITVG